MLSAFSNQRNSRSTVSSSGRKRAQLEMLTAGRRLGYIPPQLVQKQKPKTNSRGTSILFQLIQDYLRRRIFFVDCFTLLFLFSRLVIFARFVLLEAEYSLLLLAPPAVGARLGRKPPSTLFPLIDCSWCQRCSFPLERHFVIFPSFYPSLLP